MKGKVLVAGGCGFIGSHTAVELLAAGYEVVIVDNLSNSKESVVGRIEQIVGCKVPFHRVDCTDEAALREVFKEYSFDAVIHFAAFKAVGESVTKPLEYLRNNLDSLMVVTQLIREFGVGNLVFSSSCTVYGEADELPVSERSPRKEASSPYGYTKQVSEDIIEQCASVYKDFSAIALRYFNPVGAHPSGLIGEEPIGVPANLIPFVTQAAAGIRGELSVFGDDYNTPDGSAVRDYIDIVDLARAHVSAVERMVDGKQMKSYEVFNIGTGRGVSVLEIIREFESATGVKVPYKIAPRRSGDIAQIWGDTTLAGSELKWHPTRTLRETLLCAWQWQENYRGEMGE